MKSASFFIAATAVLVSAPALQAQDEQQPKRTAIIKLFDREAIENWAKCAWGKAPVSAQSLVDFQSRNKPTPKNDGIPFADGQEVLNYRINAVCGDMLPRDHRNALGVSITSAKKRILHEARPDEPSAKEGKIKSYLCSFKLDGRYRISEFDLEKPKPRRQIPGVKADCFRIESDGTLSNA